MPNNNHADTMIHCLLIYPFLGLEVGSTSHKLFVKLIEQCKQSSGGTRPIVIHNQRAKKAEAAQIILEKLSDSIEVVKNWGADTCQDWLDGFGYVLNSKVPSESKANHRVVLLPGDLVQVEDEVKLFNRLDEFIRYNKKPFLVGDFDSVNPLSAKELIDLYGVCPLVANWFPNAWEAIRALQIRKPRSEFLNLAVTELRRLLQKRVFVYEQTLNMLIVQWDSCWRESNKDPRKADRLWYDRVDTMYLGKMSDDPTGRNYRGAIDQIERTERMLRVIWRELQGWNLPLPPKDFRKLAKRYERLDEHSTRIRDAARIAIWAQIAP